MSMKFTALIVVSLMSGLILSSCKSSLKNFTPAHLIAPHPNDAPGIEISRKAERDKREKEGRYKIGEELPVAGGKAMLFMSNPDYDTKTKPVGKLVEATSAKVIFCEGLYYFVETNNQDRGYIRETDLSPATLGDALPEPSSSNIGGGAPAGFSSSAPSIYPGDIAPLPVEAGPPSLFPGAGGLLLGGEDQGATATTQSGRVVNIKTRDTGRNKDFEKMKASLEKHENEAKAGPKVIPTPEPLPPLPAASTDVIPDLPEPSSGGAN